MAEPRSADSLREFDVYAFAGRQVDFGTLELRANGKIFRLTLMEAELLRHLIRNSGKVVSRKQILEEVWGLARRHRHSRHRQLYCSIAQVYRTGSLEAAAPADGARHRISFLARAARWALESDPTRPDSAALCYRARASTSVTSSGCSLPPIQSATAPVTTSLMRDSG